MNSTEAIRNYKHDITGKFRDISSVVNALDESSFEDASNHEVFHAVHEVLFKMVRTSNQVILSQLKQDLRLEVSNSEPDLSLPKLSIGEINVRSVNDGYILYRSENSQDEKVSIEVLKILLPVKRIEYV